MTDNKLLSTKKQKPFRIFKTKLEELKQFAVHIIAFQFSKHCTISFALHVLFVAQKKTNLYTDHYVQKRYTRLAN